MNSYGHICQVIVDGPWLQLSPMYLVSTSSFKFKIQAALTALAAASPVVAAFISVNNCSLMSRSRIMVTDQNSRRRIGLENLRRRQLQLPNNRLEIVRIKLNIPTNLAFLSCRCCSCVCGGCGVCSNLEVLGSELVALKRYGALGRHLWDEDL
jgi:hypothetical protein